MWTHIPTPDKTVPKLLHRWEEMSEHDHYEKVLKRRRGCIGLTIAAFMIVVGLAAILKLVFIQSVAIDDQSMYPTLAEGSVVWCVRTDEAVPGDMILIGDDNGAIIRRVLAGPDSTVVQQSEGITIDGEIISRTPSETRVYYSATESGDGLYEHQCAVFVEEVGQTDIATCGIHPELDVTLSLADGIELADNEYYVRCDNRQFCAAHDVTEGVISADGIMGRVRWLMHSKDESREPFYKRWFGQFHTVR